LLRPLEHRPDFGTVDHVRDRTGDRADAVNGVRDGLPYSPADLGQGVGQLGVPAAIAHTPILSLL
jgi:hypothetical protein